MRIRMAVCRTVLGIAFVALAGCASLSRGNLPLAGEKVDRQPKERFVFRDGKGAAQANAPATLAQSQPADEKPKTEPTPKAESEPKLVAKSSSESLPTLPEADKTGEKSDSPPKLEPDLSLYSAIPSELNASPENKESESSLPVLDASLALSKPAATEPVVEKAPPREELSLAGLTNTEKSPNDPPAIRPIPMTKPTDPVMESQQLKPILDPPVALTPSEDGPTVAEADQAEAVEPAGDEHLPTTPAISRSEPIAAAAGKAESGVADEATSELAALPPLLSLSPLPKEPTKPSAAMDDPPAANSTKSESEADDESGTEVAAATPPVSLSTMAAPTLPSPPDFEPAPEAPEQKPSKEATAEESMVSKPTEEVVALKPSSQEPAGVGELLAPPTPTLPATAQDEPLMVRRLTLCRQVHGFGKIEPFTAEALYAGQQVLVYAEIDNFLSKQIGSVYETQLASLATIETPDGAVLTPVEFDPVVDRSESQRTDFFCHYRFRLPESLTPGEYVLRLRVKDLQRGEFGEGQLTFKIGSLTK